MSYFTNENPGTELVAMYMESMQTVFHETLMKARRTGSPQAQALATPHGILSVGIVADATDFSAAVIYPRTWHPEAEGEGAFIIETMGTIEDDELYTNAAEYAACACQMQASDVMHRSF